MGERRKESKATAERMYVLTSFHAQSRFTNLNSLPIENPATGQMFAQ